MFDYSYDGVMRSFEASFERTGLDRFDILFCHDVDVFTHGSREASDARIEEFMRGGYYAMLSLRDQLYRPGENRDHGEAPFQSIEGLSLGVDLAVRYALDPAQLNRVAATLPMDIDGDLVEPAVTGFHCRSEDDWYAALTALYRDPALCLRQGQAARAAAMRSGDEDTKFQSM